MRCKACNAMMRITRTKHGIEDLCPRCKSWAFSAEIDDDFLPIADDGFECQSISKIVSISELGIDVDLEEDSDIMDRNHESYDSDFFDKYTE